MNCKKGKIIYIAGYGRSGTTLLDVVLGNSKNCIGAGEISNFYIDLTDHQNYVFDKKRQDFWNSVEEIVSKKLEQVIENNNLKVVQIQMESNLGIILQAIKKYSKEQYLKIQNILFDTIKFVSKCEVVVDSSKTSRMTIWRPLMLSKLDGYEIRIIHVVRDGRSVLSSQLKGDNRKMMEKKENQKLSWPFLRTVVGWSTANFSAIFYNFFFKEKFHLIFYEDLISNPNLELKKLQKFTELDLSDTIQKLDKEKPIFGEYQFRGNRLLRKPICGIKNNSRKELNLFYELFYWALCGVLHLFLYRVLRKKQVFKY